MSNCAIVGINWGDEGKGRMVDLLTEKFDIVEISKNKTYWSFGARFVRKV